MHFCLTTPKRVPLSVMKKTASGDWMKSITWLYWITRQAKEFTVFTDCGSAEANCRIRRSVDHAKLYQTVHRDTIASQQSEKHKVLQRNWYSPISMLGQGLTTKSNFFGKARKSKFFRFYIWLASSKRAKKLYFFPWNTFVFTRKPTFAI